jgi:hypothetical protein
VSPSPSNAKIMQFGCGGAYLWEKASPPPGRNTLVLKLCHL